MPLGIASSESTKKEKLSHDLKGWPKYVIEYMHAN